MKHIKYTTVVICVLSLMLLLVPSMAAPAGTPEKSKRGKIEPITYKPGEVIVIWKDGAAASDKARVKSSAGVKRALATSGGRVRKGRELLKLSPGVSTEEAVGKLKESPAVKAAGLNRLVKIDYTPSSPDFPNQWGLNNTGQTIGGQAGTPDADIDAPEAWDTEQGNSSPTTVAVIDTGIDLNHPNLRDRLWVNSADPVDGVDNDGNGYIDDYNGYNFAGISNYGVNWVHCLGGDGNSQFVAQGFRAQGINGQCRMEGLEMFFYGKWGSPTETITYAIRSSLSGPNIVETNPISPDRIASEGYSFVYEPFTSVANLTPGNDYYFVVSTSAISAGSGYIIVSHTGLYEEDFDAYVEGSEWLKRGGVWTEYPDDDFYFKSSGYYCNHDHMGHGTHCCGIVGAADSGTGSVGVAPGNATRIMALKAGDSAGGLWESDVFDAIDYASSMGADIISMSFGGGGYDPVEQVVINNAYAAGCTLFAAAGNSGNTTNSYPAACANVIGVGATDNRDQKADFSTCNSSVDVSAPGVDYYSTMPTYPVSMNGYGYAQNYDYMSGTSMACPCAAGTGALVHSQNPSYTPDQIQSRLQSKADDLGVPGRDDYFGWGRVNAGRALSTAPAITGLNPDRKTAGDPAFTLTVNGTDFISGSKVRWNGSDRATTYASPTQLTASIPASDIATAGTASVTVFNPGPGGGTSNPQTFTINNPAPITTSISPISKTAGDAAFILVVNGTRFNKSSKVRWNGSDRETAYMSQKQLTASIPASDIATAGTASVTVFNPGPGGGTSNPQVFTVLTTVPVGTNPCAVGLNPATGKVYVANDGSDSVSVIDGKTDSVVATVGVGDHPCAVGINPTNNRIYVANRGSGTVSVINGATNIKLATVPVGSFYYPCDIGVNPTTNKVYVANSNTTIVSVIDGNNNVAPITVEHFPVAIGINPTTNRIYVAHRSSKKVSVIDGSTDTLLTTVTLGNQYHNHYDVGVNTKTNKIYVPDYESGTVSVIDGNTNSLLTTVTVGTNPYRVGVNSDTNKVYVANYGSKSVSVIDGETNSIATVAVGTNPCKVGVSPTTNKIYVANQGSNDVSVIDGATNGVVPVGVGTSPRAVGVNPATGKVYIANYGSSNVSVMYLL